MSEMLSCALASASQDEATMRSTALENTAWPSAMIMSEFFDGHVGSERAAAATGGDLDEPVAAAISGELGAEHPGAGPGSGRHDNRTGRVGEQDAAPPLLRVDAAREDIGGDDQHRSAVRAHEAVGQDKRIEETGAGAREVDAARVAETQAMGEQRRRRRK